MVEATVQRATPADVEPLGKLSDRIFRKGATPGANMPKEFPLMFSEENAHNLYFIEADGEPVSLVGMMPGHVYSNGVRVSVASMGSVCTLEEYRKHHYASQIVGQVIADFSPATSVLLVSGGLPIYRRVGCVDFGEWLSVDLAPLPAPHAAGEFEIKEGIREIQPLLNLYAAESYRFQRTVSDMAALLRTLSVPRFHDNTTPPRVFCASHGGEVYAYVVALHTQSERGAATRLLEWAGARSAIPWLADHARRYFDSTKSSFFIAKSDYTMRFLLRRLPAVITKQNNEGTLRVLNPSLLLKEMGPLIEQLFGARLELQQTGVEEWRVHWQASSDSPTPEWEGRLLTGYAELSAWLFGVQGLNLPLPRTDDLNYI